MTNKFHPKYAALFKPSSTTFGYTSQFARHQLSKWNHGPAFYLHLNTVEDFFNKTQEAMPPFSKIILKRYPQVNILWDDEMLEAFMSAGHTILCLDSVDEIFEHPTTDDVKEHLRRIASSLAADSKFIMTCRTTHFEGFEELLAMETWPGYTVRDTFEVVELLPFSDKKISSYLADMGHASASEEEEVDVSATLRRLIKDHVAVRTAWEREELELLELTIRQPAMLAVFSDLIGKGAHVGKSSLVWLEEILRLAVLEFNVKKRTKEFFRDKSGNVIDFNLDDRVFVLQEMAWFMAERGLDSIDILNLPSRMAAIGKLDRAELQRDVRSQTLFELCSDSVTEGGRIQFTLRDHAGGSHTVAEPGRTDVSPQLKLALEHAPCLASSVSGAYVGAKHISKLLHVGTLFGDMIDATDVLAVLGQLPLGPCCACLLQQMLSRIKLESGSTLLEHVEEVAGRTSEQLHDTSALARFHPRLQFLPHNCSMLRMEVAPKIIELSPWGAR